jgi:hypothetical protein
MVELPKRAPPGTIVRKTASGKIVVEPKGIAYGGGASGQELERIKKLQAEIGTPGAGYAGTGTQATSTTPPAKVSTTSPLVIPRSEMKDKEFTTVTGPRPSTAVSYYEYPEGLVSTRLTSSGPGWTGGFTPSQSFLDKTLSELRQKPVSLVPKVQTGIRTIQETPTYISTPSAPLRTSISEGTRQATSVSTGGAFTLPSISGLVSQKRQEVIAEDISAGVPTKSEKAYKSTFIGSTEDLFEKQSRGVESLFDKASFPGKGATIGVTETIAQFPLAISLGLASAGLGAYYLGRTAYKEGGIGLVGPAIGAKAADVFPIIRNPILEESSFETQLKAEPGRTTAGLLTTVALFGAAGKAIRAVKPKPITVSTAETSIANTEFPLRSRLLSETGTPKLTRRYGQGIEMYGERIGGEITIKEYSSKSAALKAAGKKGLIKPFQVIEKGKRVTKYQVTTQAPVLRAAATKRVPSVATAELPKAINAPEVSGLGKTTGGLTTEIETIRFEGGKLPELLPESKIGTLTGETTSLIGKGKPGLPKVDITPYELYEKPKSILPRKTSYKRTGAGLAREYNLGEALEKSILGDERLVLPKDSRSYVATPKARMTTVVDTFTQDLREPFKISRRLSSKGLELKGKRNVQQQRSMVFVPDEYGFKFDLREPKPTKKFGRGLTRKEWAEKTTARLTLERMKEAEKAIEKRSGGGVSQVQKEKTAQASKATREGIVSAQLQQTRPKPIRLEASEPRFVPLRGSGGMERTLSFDSPSRMESVMLPMQKQIVLPRQEQIVLPRQEQIVLPKQKEMVLPRQEQVVLPKQKQTVLPKQKQTVLPRQEQIVLPKMKELTEPVKPPVVVPPIPPIESGFLFPVIPPLGGFQKGKSVRDEGLGRGFGYAPSFTALALDIKGLKPEKELFTGFELRPIVKTKKKKSKRKKKKRR